MSSELSLESESHPSDTDQASGTLTKRATLSNLFRSSPSTSKTSIESSSIQKSNSLSKLFRYRRGECSGDDAVDVAVDDRKGGFMLRLSAAFRRKEKKHPTVVRISSTEEIELPEPVGVPLPDHPGDAEVEIEVIELSADEK